jgi:hypothetical protein
MESALHKDSKDLSKTLRGRRNVQENRQQSKYQDDQDAFIECHEVRHTLVVRHTPDVSWTFF